MKYKIIITGPVGSGKTTAINSLTGNNALMTDVAVSDEVTRERKLNTTVAMDFGVVQVNDDVAHVYGTPGQQRFNFMWEVLSEGAHGLVILLDNTRNYPFRDLKYYTEHFSDLIKQTKLIIGITRSDELDELPINVYQKWLHELQIEADVRFIDARKKGDVEFLIRSLVEKIASSPRPKVKVKSITNINEQEVESSTHLTSNVTDEVGVIAKARKESTVATNDALVKQVTQAVKPPTEDDLLSLDEVALTRVAELQGVNGVTLTNSIGDLLHSTIDDDDINEFVAFLSGITPTLEEVSGMGTINRIMLRGPKDENLTVFVERERSLGVSSDKGVSVPALSQKIEDMLQWA